MENAEHDIKTWARNERRTNGSILMRAQTGVGYNLSDRKACVTRQRHRPEHLQKGGTNTRANDLRGRKKGKRAKDLRTRKKGKEQAHAKEGKLFEGSIHDEMLDTSYACAQSR